MSGDFAQAEELWRQAVEFACLEGQYHDAAEWSFSCRNARIADAGPFAGSYDYYYGARALQQRGGGPLQPALHRLAERTTNRQLDGKTRAAALAARDYVRRGYAAGSWRQHAHAHELLARAYRDSREHLAAVASLITARQVEKAVETAAEAGDDWLDVTLFLTSPARHTRSASYRVLAEQADLIPDAAAATIEAAAMSDARPALSGVPQFGWGWDTLYLAALRLLAGLAWRLSAETAEELVDLLEPLVPRDPGHYRHSDEWHIQLLARLADARPDLRPRAITQLVELGTSGGAGHYLRRHAIGTLQTYRDDAAPLLRTKADGGDAEARRLLALVAADPSEAFTAEEVEAARVRLLTPPIHDPGVRTFGSRIVDDATMLNELPSEGRLELVEALVSHAENEPSPKWHAQDYLWAAVDLAREVGPAPGLHVRALAIADAPQPESHGLPESPLSAFRMTGMETDPRPAAAALAARLAATPEERARAQRTCLILLAGDAVPARHLAWAIFFSYGDDIAEALSMLAAQAAPDYRALAAQRWPRTAEADDYVGPRLAGDPNAMVRRTLATVLAEVRTTRALSEAERDALDRLGRDPRHSVRRLVAAASALA